MKRFSQLHVMKGWLEFGATILADAGPHDLLRAAGLGDGAAGSSRGRSA